MKIVISFLGVFFMVSVLSIASAEDLITSQDQKTINTSSAWCEENDKSCKQQCRNLGSWVGMIKTVAKHINKDKE